MGMTNRALHELFFSSNSQSLLLRAIREKEGNKPGVALDLDERIKVVLSRHVDWMTVKKISIEANVCDLSARKTLLAMHEDGLVDRKTTSSNAHSHALYRRKIEVD